MNAERTIAPPWALLAGCLLLAGCGKADRSCPVTSKVSVNGKPAGGLYVVLQAADGKGQQDPASARTDKDGSFSLRVPEPGEYVVTAFWPRLTIEQGDTVEGEDAFRGHFRNPKRPAAKVTITSGKSALPPIELKFNFARP
jgi:hypothetical protein